MLSMQRWTNTVNNIESTALNYNVEVTHSVYNIEVKNKELILKIQRLSQHLQICVDGFNDSGQVSHSWGGLGPRTLLLQHIMFVSGTAARNASAKNDECEWLNGILLLQHTMKVIGTTALCSWNTQWMWLA